MEKTNERDNRIFRTLFIIISILIPVVVAILLYMPKGQYNAGGWYTSLPLYNAIINTLTALVLVAGYIFVKTGFVNYHKASMISAFVLGSIFLIFYILYHANVPSTRFGGEGLVRSIYFLVLISHILFAFAVVPLVLMAMYFALFNSIEKHRKIVKYTFPIWLYVSVTGVVVYILISPYYPH